MWGSDGGREGGQLELLDISEKKAEHHFCMSLQFGSQSCVSVNKRMQLFSRGSVNVCHLVLRDFCDRDPQRDDKKHNFKKSKEADCADTMSDCYTPPVRGIKTLNLNTN